MKTPASSENESSNCPHNGTFLPLKMLISHSLKCPYLHYKHSSQTLRKSEEAREKFNLLFSIHQRCSAATNCVCWEVPCEVSATKTLHYSQTSPFYTVAHSDAGCDHEKTAPLRNNVTVVPQKIRVIPAEQHTYSKSPSSTGFVELCGIPCRSLNLTEAPGVQKTISVLQYV